MTQSSPPKQQPPKNKRKKILILLGFCILILAAICLFFYLKSAQPTAPVVAVNTVSDEEEEGEDARRADPTIAKLVNEHTKNTAWQLNDTEHTFAQKNRVIRINDELTITAPAKTEEETQESAKIAQAKYAAQYMSPELIDVLYREYKQNGKAVLESFGIQQVCQMDGCKYQVSAHSSLLQAYQGKIEKGDTIDSINGQSLSKLSDYKSAKDLLFQNNPTMIQLTSAQGNQRIIYINHSKSPLSSNL